MQLWFWAAVGSALMSGLGNFIFKIAAKRNYSSELFSLYGGLTSILVVVPFALIVSGPIVFWPAAIVAVLAGCIAAGAGVSKVYALRHIDTTIFFPLYKLISPFLAILFGLVFFGEQFSAYEWLGLGLGLLVPLLLISKSEKGRQSNMMAGLVLLVIGAIISATAAALNKYSTELWNDVWWLLWFSSIGVFFGALLSVWWKNGLRAIVRTVKEETDKKAIFYASLRGVIMCIALWLGLFAFVAGGTLAAVHTIQSMYILIPIVLAIILYNEHWNTQKVVAIVLSIAALAFLH